MKRILATSLSIVILTVSVLALSGCDENQLQKAKNSGQRIARVTNALIDLVPSFQQEGSITTEEADSITKGLTDFKAIVNQFNARVATYKTFDPAVKADLATAFADVTSALAALNNEGVLRIKNPTVKGRVQMSLTLANLAAQEVTAALQDQEIK